MHRLQNNVIGLRQEKFGCAMQTRVFAVGNIGMVFEKSERVLSCMVRVDGEAAWVVV